LSDPQLPQITIEAFDLGSTALFLDVDGTLLDIAAAPEGVVVPAGLVANLRQLEAALSGAMAIVTGRTLVDLDQLFRGLKIRAAGVHGAQMRYDPDQTAAIEAFPVLPDRLWSALNVALAEFPDVYRENKRFSFAIHFRARPDLAGPLWTLLQRLIDDETTLDLMLMEAQLAYEIKPRGFDKGAAIASFMTRPPFAGRTPLFIGNDATDDVGFAVVSDRGGIAYSVGARRSRTVAMFPDPATVRRWLAGHLGRFATSSKEEGSRVCA